MSKFKQLPNKKYDILYADPPWDYRGQTQHAGSRSRDTGGAGRHYPTVELADLKTLDIPAISNPCSLLFMWSSSPHLDQAIALGQAWQFQYKTVAFVWHKQSTNPGFYTMSQCELCLVFKKGTIPSPRGARNIRQYHSEKRTRHSAKPDEFRTRIERMFPEQSRCELFARTACDGWDSWGNEL